MNYSLSRLARIGILSLPILVAAALLQQGCMTSMIDRVAFQMTAPDSNQQQLRLPYQTTTVPLSDGRKLEARWVDSTFTGGTHRTVILFNGIGGSLTDWNYPQKRLYDAQISSVAFNYGDVAEIGKSRGLSRLRDIEGAVRTLLKKSEARNGGHSKIFLLGHSMGGAVLLELYPKLDTSQCEGVILCNPFSSLKAWMLYHHHFPKAFSFVLPDYFNNVPTIQKVRKPVLVITSQADTVNPSDQALQVYDSARQPKSIRIFKQLRHNDLFGDDSDDYWEVILDFIKRTPDA